MFLFLILKLLLFGCCLGLLGFNCCLVFFLPICEFFLSCFCYGFVGFGFLGQLFVSILLSLFEGLGNVRFMSQCELEDLLHVFRVLGQFGLFVFVIIQVDVNHFHA